MELRRVFIPLCKIDLIVNHHSYYVHWPLQCCSHASPCRKSDEIKQCNFPVQPRHRQAAPLEMVSTVRLSQAGKRAHLRCISIVPRPCANEERIRPSELQDHRVTHRVLGPCCLCPMVHASQPDFVEAAIYVLPVGPFSGQYVASCAQDRCGYFGESR